MGLTVDGLSQLGNENSGIVIDGGSMGNLVGMRWGKPLERNYIASNQLFGVSIHSGSGNQTKGNSIGLSINGDSRINGYGGVQINNSNRNQVGGTPELGNIIHYSSQPGVQVVGSSVGNLLTGNTFQGGGFIPIDLNGDEKTYNDPQDPDQGPNDLLNHPIIELAVTDSTGSVVAGRIETTPYTRITVEVLIGSEPGNILSFSQAPLGTVEVVTDASGIGRWIVETDRSFAIGPTINAIAHNSSSGSSELSIKSGASLSVKRKLSLSQPSIAENGGSLSLTVYRASIDPVGNVNVSLSSSDPSRLQLPLAVVIPFGQQSVTVRLER